MSQQINLFNPIFRKVHQKFSLLAMLLGLAAAVIFALLFYSYAAYKVGQLNTQAEQIAKRFDAEQARVTARSAPQPQDALLKNQIQAVEKKLAEQFELVDTFKSGVAGNDTGYSEYMRAFARQVVQGLWLTSFKVIGDTQVSLSGGAVDPGLVPEYIQRLGNEKVMSGKKFTTLQMQQAKVDAAQAASAVKASYVEFTLHSSIDGEDKK